MKKQNYFKGLLFSLISLLTVAAWGQKENQLNDSIIGFDRELFQQEAELIGLDGKEKEKFVNDAYEDYKQSYLKKSTETSTIQMKSLIPQTPDPNCTNIGFENGTFDGWCYYWDHYTLDHAHENNTGTGNGSCSMITAPTDNGITNSGYTDDKRFKINHIGDPNDPFIGPVVYDGNYSIRVGNSHIKHRKEQVRKTIQIDQSQPLLYYNYAVVMQDPGHNTASQPYFEIFLEDVNGNVIPCSEYRVVAGQGIPGFQSVGGEGEVGDKPWTTNVINLLDPTFGFVHGDVVNLVMEVSDCAARGHYGYAFMEASCGTGGITTSTDQPCINQALTFYNEAIGSYTNETYDWTFYDTDGTTVIGTSSAPNPPFTYYVDGTYKVSLSIGLPSGCSVYFENEIYVDDCDPCEDIDIDFSGSCVNENISFSMLSPWGVVNSSNISWDFGDGSPGSSQQNPTHVYTSPGQYEVTVSYTDLYEPDCDPREQVVNGDFENGNRDFDSHFQYMNPLACKERPEYNIQTDLSSTHGRCYSCDERPYSDHTPSPGVNLLAYGSPVVNISSPETIWEQSVSVSSNELYSFEAWFNDCSREKPKRMELRMIVEDGSGNLIAQTPIFNGGIFNGTWTMNSIDFNSGNNSSVTAKIVCLTMIDSKEVHGIDDISIQQPCDTLECKEEATQIITINECVDCDVCPTFIPEVGKRYWVSVWVKEEHVNQVFEYDSYLEVNFVNNNSGAVFTNDFHTSGEIIDGWQRIAGYFYVPPFMEQIEVSFVNSSSSGGDVFFDDFRIHPYNASMKSYVYDVETYWYMAELDGNNYATFYEYDKEGKLVRIKKETEKGIVTIKESRSSNTKD